MNRTYLLEVVFQVKGFAFTGRSAVEDPLDEALIAAGIGKVIGGGSSWDKGSIDVKVSDFNAGLAIVRGVLQELEVAPSTVIYHNEADFIVGTGEWTAYSVYE